MDKLTTIYNSFSNKERLLFIGATALLAICLGVLIGRAVYVKNFVPAYGGEYSEGFVGQPAYVQPVLAAGDVDRSLIRLLFSNVKDLADHISPSKDARVWTVRLRPGLLWSDGRKLTSDDIVFTVEQIQRSETRSPLQASWQGISALRISELEIQFTLPSGYALFEDNLHGLYPIPRHIFADVPASNWRLSDYTLKPIGSGPYMFDSYAKESNGFIKEYRVKPNPHYTHAKAFIEQVRFSFFPDGNALLAAFNKGSIDGLTSPDLGTVQGIQRSYKTHEFSIPSYYALFFNQSQSVPLKDASVRKALAMSVDREAIIETVFDGHALPSFGPIPPASGRATATSTEVSMDAAARILDEAGWKVAEDGVRKKSVANGSIALEIVITVPEIPFLVKTAEALKETWYRLGVQVTVAQLPTGETMTRTIKDRDYQTLLFGNVVSGGLDLYPFWHTKERFSPGLNLALYSSSTIDALLEAAQKEQDANARFGKLGDAERGIVSEVPAIFLYSPNYLYFSSKEVRGVGETMISEPADRFLNLPKWYVKTGRAK